MTRSLGRRGCLLLVAFLVTSFVAMGVVFVLLATSGEEAEPVDCARFSVTPAQWSSARYDGRVEITRGLRACGRLEGRTAAQVQAMLGPPDAGGASAAAVVYRLPYDRGVGWDALRLFLEDGRVANVLLSSGTISTPP